ncbi:hypothetical protein KUTeg_019942 [Tegillarca granosa]|uniref:APCDD1 domain-containing protein n=1 Tax=Tegillarca granosa TaxID=220873 RepID=A0ABQ9EDW8_TEGGR|nr:hypothetical protein KUTeg_019942 [Tegillarca granosa]
MVHVCYRRIGYLLVLFHLVIGTPYYNVYNKRGWKERTCSSVIEQIKNQKLEVPIPPNIRGEWTSYRCEVRPGPEFVLRKYIFKRNKFYIHQYYYTDPRCSIPLYGVVSEGTYKLLQASWVVPGGMEAKYHLRNVTVIPYNKNVIDLFKKQKPYNCKELSGMNWQLYKGHQILNFPSYNRYKRLKKISRDFDCTRSFNFTLHELQLIRLEIRHYKKINRKIHKHYSFLNRKSTRKVKELYLGDIHTETRRRHTYRPTSYQEPLRSLLNLPGEWESIKCETRQYGQFLIRHLSFLPDGKSWQGQYHFFQDSLCSQPTFSLDVKGNYVKGRNSQIIPGSTEFNFRVTRLKVTPKNKQTTDSLNYFNGHDCGMPKSWRINMQQDVTSTGGCLTLGITLPNVEFEIMKMEIRNRRIYLYIGKRPSDGHSMRTPDRRPTAFQSPLVKCTNNMIHDNNIVISRYQKLQNVVDVPVNSVSLMKRSTVVGIISTLLLKFGDIYWIIHIFFLYSYLYLLCI